jgi:hypothetical protein
MARSLPWPNGWKQGEQKLTFTQTGSTRRFSQVFELRNQLLAVEKERNGHAAAMERMLSEASDERTKLERRVRMGQCASFFIINVAADVSVFIHVTPYAGAGLENGGASKTRNKSR